MGFDVNTGKGGIRPVINVTPLVDVVLVLLIIFMVVTPMLTKQFTVQVPPTENKEVPAEQEPDDTQIVVKLEKTGSVTVNAKDVAMDALPQKLAGMLAAKSKDDRIVFFDADNAAPYGTAVQVMDIARGAGAVTVGILPDALGPARP